MKFSFDDTKSKGSLLAKYSEETIMKAMGVPIEERSFCSPFRDDRNPSCSVWRVDRGKLYFMDWATFTEPVDVFGLYMYLKGCDFNQSVEGLWSLMEEKSSDEEFTEFVGSVGPKESVSRRMTATTRPWAYMDYRWWQQFGIDAETLAKFNVEPVDKVWIGDDLNYQFIPQVVQQAYLYTFSDGIKVYFPLREYNRFYCNNGKSLQGYDQIPPSGDLLVITKSLKDVMLLYSLGITSVAPQSEGTQIDFDIFEELKSRFESVVVLFDNDRAGIKALRKYKAIGLKVYCLKRQWQTKDVSDFYLKYGVETTSRLISESKEAHFRGGLQFFNFKL